MLLLMSTLCGKPSRAFSVSMTGPNVELRTARTPRSIFPSRRAPTTPRAVSSGTSSASMPSSAAMLWVIPSVNENGIPM